MSLATFKKKSINKYSTATKISGKPCNKYWLYQGPYGTQDTVASTIFKNSLVGLNGELGTPYEAQNAGFSINGPTRSMGAVGQHMLFSQSRTPFRGVYPIGNGGTNGRYPTSVQLNIQPVLSKIVTDTFIVRPSVLSTKGMLARRFRWINSAGYPNYWVQPNYTGNLTDNSSQGLYVQNKSAANYCHYDVNNPQNYVDYHKSYGPMGCQTTPARGYTMNLLQSNAPYTKTLHQTKDASDYTLKIQRRCQNPLGFQKPFPYQVQTGTGVLTGGINVNNVANACNTSNTTVIPPDWYTGGYVLNDDGSKVTLNDQLVKRHKLKHVGEDVRYQVFRQTFLDGTTN
jgi:hypothetical protein